MPQGNKGIRDKDRKELEVPERRGREEGRGEGIFVSDNCIWIERRQTWPTDKWQFVKVIGENHY